MKKLIYCALALAAGLFATSCQQENLEPVAQENTVTFTVETPEAIQTKAIADGMNVNKLIYEVWLTPTLGDLTTGAQKLYQETQGMRHDNGVNKTVITLDLVNDQKYTVLLWAQVDGTGVYNTTELNDVHYNSTEAGAYAANDERLAAFYGVAYVNDGKTVTKEGAEAPARVELRRPFAQVNLGTLNTSTEQGSTTGYTIDIKESNMILRNVPTHFNVVNGMATEPAEMEFLMYNAPCMDKAITDEDATLTGFDNPKYWYAGMNYVFASNAETGITAELEYNIVTKLDGVSEVVVNNTILNVPLKENYRTNIIGNLLTSSTDYEVVIDARFAVEPGYVVTVVDDAVGLQEAIANAQDNEETEIKLESDINLNDLLAMTKAAAKPATVVIEAGKNIVLDLNGFSLTATDETEKNYSSIDNRGTLVVKNSMEGTTSSMTVKATVNSGWNRYSAVLANNPGGHLTVESGVIIEHLGGTDMAYGIDNLTNGKGTSAVTVINGATVKSPYRAVRQFLNGVEANNSLVVKANSTIQSTEGNKSIWMQDPSKNANTGSLVVEEGANLMTDVYLSVTAGSTEWPVSVSIAASALKEGATVASSNVPAGYKVEEVDGNWKVNFYPVAKIGEKGYVTLNDAVVAVQDGETITLVADETFTATNYYDNGGWKDGLGYSGDKSFTIDLGGYTIKQDGSLNDYLVWIKNSGAKPNTITFRNGTMDAGTTAYCAIATASTNAQKLTVNLEDINLINNISNGAVVKARGGSELNVKAGTVITGKNSYTGIEAAGTNTVVNVYEGAEIYQNGTSSYVGAIAGASQNATLNIYGGKGKSAKCGIIVMSTGATINVSGGEWTSNGDGTVVGDNQAVLVCQNNRYETSWACKSVLNVTGGTFKGGYNCYGMGPGVEADDAQIKISGGNFNADPKSYVVNGYKAVESNGVYNVVVDPVAKIGETEYATLQEAFNVGGNVTLLRDVTITEPATLAGGKTAVLDLNGKTLTAELVSALVSIEGSDLTVKNGKVVAYESTVRAVGGKAVVESGEYTSIGTALDSPATYRYSLDCREGGELIIDGGTFKSNNGMINVGSTVTINGGKFENIVEKTMTRHFAYVSAPLTINDGAFYGKANSSAGGCFFCGAAEGGNIQVNGGKFTSLWTSGSVNRIFEYYYGGTITVTGGMFNTNGGIATFVTENTDEATKAAYPYVAK